MGASPQIKYCIDAELEFARTKYPSNHLMLAALVEEVGELAQALIDNSRGKTSAQHVYEEAIQVAAMAIRVAEEGSEEFPYLYTDECYQKFPVNKWLYDNSQQKVN